MPISWRSSALGFGLCLCLVATKALSSPGLSDSTPADTSLSDAVAESSAAQSFQDTSFRSKRIRVAAYVRIKSGTVRVLDTISPDSPVLGLAQRDSYYPLLAETPSWCRIDFNGKPGWLEKRHVVIVEAPTSPFLEQLAVVVAILLAVAVVGVVVWLLARHFDKLRGSWMETIPTEKTALIVAKVEKRVQQHVTGKMTTLGQCFTEIGFTVHRTTDAAAAAKIILNLTPDIVAVDPEIDPTAGPVIEQLFATEPSLSHVIAIVYNARDPVAAKKFCKAPNMQFLGVLFTDRDLFGLVTPLLISEEEPPMPVPARKGMEQSAFEGGVNAQSLQEVFQFVEIWHKTGCLLIEDKRPYGIVFFKQGMIVYAATSRSAAKQAVFDILGLGRGRFRFVLNKEPKDTNCHISTLGTLMEWCKELDEVDVS